MSLCHFFHTKMLALCSFFVLSVLSAENVGYAASNRKDSKNEEIKTDFSFVLSEYKAPTWDVLQKEAKAPLDEIWSQFKKGWEAFHTKPQQALLEKECSLLLPKGQAVWEITPKNAFCFAWLTKNFNQELQDTEGLSQNPNTLSQQKAGTSKNPGGQFRASDVLKLANASFTVAYRAFRNARLEELQAAFKILTTHNNTPFCSYRGAGSALLALAETYLPEPEAWNLMKSIYAKVSPCALPSDDFFERMHQRMGFLFIAHKDYQNAAQALRRSLDAENPSESYRSLFWLGLLAGEPTENNIWWQHLVNVSPMGLHSVLAQHLMGKDPLDSIMRQNVVLKAERREAEGWNFFSAVAFYYELVLARSKNQDAYAFSEFVAKYVKLSKPEQLLFLAVLHSRVENYRAVILSLSQYLRLSPQTFVNLDFLNIFFPRPYQEIILQNARNVDPMLIFALIRQESSFQAHARSVADARGLMQLLPSTARRLQKISPDSLYHPETNVRLGVLFLEQLLNRYQGRVEYVLAAYNAGPGNMDKWLARYPTENPLLFSELVPYKETRNYINLIQRNAYWYGRLLTQENSAKTRQIIKQSLSAVWRSEVVHDLLGVAWDTNYKIEARAKLQSLVALDLQKRLNVASWTPPLRKWNVASRSDILVSKDSQNNTSLDIEEVNSLQPSVQGLAAKPLEIDIIENTTEFAEKVEKTQGITERLPPSPFSVNENKKQYFPFLIEE